MSDENKRTTNKAPSLRTGAGEAESRRRSANKSKSIREATYREPDPNRPGPQTIYLNMDQLHAASKADADDVNELKEALSAAEERAAEKRTAEKHASEKHAAEKHSTEKKAVEKISLDEEDFEETAPESDEEKPAKASRPAKTAKSARPAKEAKKGSFIDSLKEKIAQATGKDAPATGSSYKKKQAQQAARNDLLKKLIIALIGVIVVVLVIILIVNNSQVKNVGEITIDSTSTTQTLIWSGARKGLTYEVYRAEGDNGQYMLVDTLTEGENSKTYDNLTSGTLYKYNIITVKGNGTKTEGTAAQAYTVPSPVTNVSAAAGADAEGTLTVKWNLLGSTSDYELKYDLYDNLRDATTVSFSADQAVADGNGGYSYTINNLVPEETYYVTLRTLCGDKSSDWSEVISGTVTEPAPAAPEVNSDQPMVALTFDGGPDDHDVTTRILTVLKDNNSKGTFFQTGVNAQAYPDLMKQIADEGHEIGNHTFDETNVGEWVTAEDITTANSAIENACGIKPKLFRAPQGEVTDLIREVCTEEEMSIILFNFDSHDWEYYDPQEIIDRIETYVEDGDIIQFRNVYDETATAIETLVPWLIDEGYQLVTVSELLQAKTGQLPEVGKVYNSASDHE